MSSGPEAVVVAAPAKVNLWLDVLGRRDDGFHELDTGLLALELADRVRVAASERPGVALELAGDQLTQDVPADGRNLAARAAARVLDHARELGRPETGLALAIEKNVPSGAGLGGGSSDAAAALLGAARVLRLDPGTERIRTWLAELGSDCAFFHDAAATGFARCIGRGERVQPLALPDRAWFAALVAPRVHCPTAEVYRALSSPLSGAPVSPSVRETLLSRTEREARLGLSNHLEAAALEAFPALVPWRHLLDASGAKHFLLSGSGSTFFGLYRDERDAREVLARVERAAADRRLPLRGLFLTRPRGRGATLSGS